MIKAVLNLFKKPKKTLIPQITVEVLGINPQTDNEFLFYNFVEKEKSARLEGWHKEIKKKIPFKPQYEDAIRTKIKTGSFKNPFSFPEYFNNEFDFIAIDFETANEDRVSACAIGLAFIKNDRVAYQTKFLIKPPKGHSFRSFHTALHGISPSDVAYSRSFHELWNNELSKYFNNNIIVFHRSSSDLSTLKKSFAYYKISGFNITYLDTAHMAKECNLPIALDALAKEFDIDMGNVHDPECDARTCAYICGELMDKLPNYRSLIKTYSSEDLENEVQKKQEKVQLENENIDIIQRYSVPKSELGDIEITDKGFLVTGNLLLPRDFYHERLIQKGGIIKKGVTSKVDFVVIGTEFGWAKIQKIHELNTCKNCNIRILSDSDLDFIIDKN